MNLDASSLNIFCPEHNSYVQYVCLVNQCYQKLMCETCLKKHRDVHRNMHITLMEMINNFKRFQKIKLEEGEDLSGLHEQIKNGARNLRGNDSKPHEIDFMIMQSLDGKDQELKYSLFNEKSQVIKNKLTSKEAKVFADELQLLLQSQQRKVLNFEKTIMESLQNQLKRATSRKVLEEKFLKESAIQQILDDLKSNNDRYNQLNKNLQKFHKGFLELKISKKIFRDMCIDTQQRFKIFTKNISQYFDQEYNKLFSFMIDTNEAINEQAAFEQQLIAEKQLQSPSQLSSPTKTIFSPLSVDLSKKKIKIPDKQDPNFQMNKMIEDLKKINQDIRKTVKQTEVYAPDVAITQSDKVFSFTPDRASEESQFFQQQQQEEQSLNFNMTANNSNAGHRSQGSTDLKNPSQFFSIQNTPSKKQMQLSQITSYSPQDNSVNKAMKAELLQRVNFTKKEYKVNLEQIENMRFGIIQNQITQIIKPLIKQTKQGTVSLKSLSFLFSTPNQSQLQNQNKGNSTQPIPQAVNGLNQTNSPMKKSVNFRIHTTSSFSTNQKTQQSKFIESEPAENISDSSRSIQLVNRQLQQANKMIKKSSSLERAGSFSIPKEQIAQLQSVNESSVCYEMSIKSDFKSANVLLLSVNPYLRTYGFLDQMNIPFAQFTNPFKQYFAIQQAKINQINEQRLKKRGSQDLDLEQNQPKKEVELSRNENSYLINYQKDNVQQVIIGLEELSNCKFLTMHQNGSIQIWQINLSPATLMPNQVGKIKEFYVCKYIYCYSEVNQNEDITQRNSNQANINEFDPILMIGGQNELNETTLSIVRYESKKNKFSEIDQFRSYHGSGAISQIQVLIDKQFKKKNVPNSLQLITDVYYVITLNLFDINEDEEVEDQPISTIPTIQVQKIQFHRDKHGSTERTMIVKIKIQNNLIIQRIMYDQINDCLWGHSDYILFKWRINFLSKCLESQESLTLCSIPKDIITSMHCNNGVIMLSSLQGNIWGVDVMLNKVIHTDFQRIKYSSINHYNKIQGKDPIYIISGAKIYLTPNNLRTNVKRNANGYNQNNSEDFNKTISSLNSTQTINATTSNTITKTKDTQQQVIPKCSSYFLYSTLSSSGVKVFCFDADFKQVICTLSGQENHLQQFITLNKENLILAVEDFNTIRFWRNEQI